MKKRIAIILIAGLSVGSLACAKSLPAESGKILIAYSSKTGEDYDAGIISGGRTAKLAKEIAAQTRGELFEIRKTEAYQDSYNEALKQQKRSRMQRFGLRLRRGRHQR